MIVNMCLRLKFVGIEDRAVVFVSELICRKKEKLVLGCFMRTNLKRMLFYEPTSTWVNQPNYSVVFMAPRHPSVSFKHIMTEGVLTSRNMGIADHLFNRDMEKKQENQCRYSRVMISADWELKSRVFPATSASRS